MDVFQHFDIRLAMLSLQVNDLAADHSIYGSRSASEFIDSSGKGTRDHAASFHAKNGAQTLSPGEHAMTHCLMNGRWILGRRRQKLLQRPIGQHTSLLQSLCEHVR